MASSRRRGGEVATFEAGACALGDAFQAVARGLAHLQDALHLQEQEAERRLHQALRLQELETERRLQEKDDAIRILQQRLQVFENRLIAVEEVAITPEVSGKEETLQLLEGRVQKVEASLKRAMDKFFPRVEALLRQLESSPTEDLRASTTSSVTGGAAAGALEKQSLSRGHPSAISTGLPRDSTASAAAAAGARAQSSSAVALRASTSASDARGRGATARGRAAAAALEEERERQRVQLRMREAKERRARSRASRSPLGEELCVAAGQGKVDDVRRLLDLGADVNYINEGGWTPLMYACYDTGNVQTASLLLEEGADVNTVDVFAFCALHVASSGNTHCVPVLIRAGADVDARDANGATPLHRAAVTNNAAAARALLAAGARRDLRCWGEEVKGKSPFDFATSEALRQLLRPRN